MAARPGAEAHIEEPELAIRMGDALRGLRHLLTYGKRGIVAADGASVVALAIRSSGGSAGAAQNLPETWLHAVAIGSDDIVVHSVHRMLAAHDPCGQGFCNEITYRVGEGEGGAAEVLGFTLESPEPNIQLPQLNDALAAMRRGDPFDDPLASGHAAEATVDFYGNGHLCSDRRFWPPVAHAVVDGIAFSQMIAADRPAAGV